MEQQKLWIRWRRINLPFQCDYNDNETLAAYAKGNYDFIILNKLKNLLFLRVPMKLLVIFKMMMLLVELRIVLY